MAIIIPTNASVTSLTGLHLYPGAISNCFMRVRMMLMERGLYWNSHHLDLKKKENMAAAIPASGCRPCVCSRKMATRFRKSAGEKAGAIFGVCLLKLAKALEGLARIMCGQYTLTDISWIPSHFVLKSYGHPFGQFHKISRWACVFAQTDSFRKGVHKWCPDFAKL